MKTRLVVGAFGAFVLGLLASAGPAAGQDKDKADFKFELYKDKKGEFRWRAVAENNKKIANSGEGYKDKAGAKEALETIQKKIGSDDMKVEYYMDKKEMHRWRLKAANGKAMASSGEGYTDKSGAEKGFMMFKKGAKDAKIEDKTEDSAR